MKRLRDTFDRCKAEGRAALVIYLTCGDPSPEESVEIMARAAAAGADVIELGVPFSDPNADGPVIQAAMQRALAAGGGLTPALTAVRALRERGCEVPVVLFGYYNPLFVYGVDRFAADAAAAGVDAVLTVDLPVDEIDELATPLHAAGVGVIPLVAPTSTDDRIARLRPLDPPFVYYVSMTGVTGASFAAARVGPERVAEVRDATGAPVAVGFGIKSPDDARRVGAYADGVVVGSAIVKRIADAPAGRAADAVADLVSALHAALG